MLRHVVLRVARHVIEFFIDDLIAQYLSNDESVLAHFDSFFEQVLPLQTTKALPCLPEAHDVTGNADLFLANDLTWKLNEILSNSFISLIFFIFTFLVSVELGCVEGCAVPRIQSNQLLFGSTVWSAFDIRQFYLQFTLMYWQI